MMADEIDVIFQSIIEGVEVDVPDENDPSILRVDELDDLELVRRAETVRQALLASGQMMEADTPTGRALHSQRVALIVELHRRGLK